jgi:hypothetical protein
MRKFFGPMGSVSRVTVESQVLKSNLLGDPSVCVVDVYIPAGHDRQELPLLVDLVGFTGSGLSHTNWVGFRENLPEIGERALLHRDDSRDAIPTGVRLDETWHPLLGPVHIAANAVGVG